MGKDECWCSEEMGETRVCFNCLKKENCQHGDILWGILCEFHGRYLLCKTDKQKENEIVNAKSAILAWFLENLPKEKENPKSDIWLDWDEKDFLHAGFNECLAEIKRRMGAKEKYGV